MYTFSRKSTDLSNIVVHVVSGDKPRWPPPINDLASFLTLTPDHLQDLDIESTSLQKERSIDNATDPLHVLPSGLLHDVRRLAATLQDMTSRDVPDFSNPKTSILASIVATVMRHCAPDAFIMERPYFATARPPRPDYRNLAPYFPMQEKATLLVMHAVVEFSDHLKKAKDVGEGDTLEHGSNDLSCAENANVNGRNSCEEEVVNGSIAGDDAVSEDDEDGAYSYCESPPSPRRYTADELAAGGYFSEYGEARTIRTLYDQDTSPPLVPSVTDHIALTYLSPAFQTSPPAIPIVCMAEYTTIFSLLKSAVYQRRAWGICEPVVGLAFEPANPVVQFVFAWADEMENNGLPVVHVAMCDPHRASNLSFGVFDVSEARFVTMFTHCCVKLRGHVTRLRSAASSNVDRTVAIVLAEDMLDWRFDLSGHTDGRLGGLDSSGRIRAWSKNVPGGLTSQAGSTSASFPSPHYTDMPPRRDQARSKTSKPSPDEGGQSTRPLPTQQPMSHEPTRTPSLVVSDHDSNNMIPPPTDASSNRVKRYSCSAFAAGGDEQDPNLLTDRWLADRTATRHTLLPLEGNVEVPKQYREFTRFMWPKGWTLMDHMPTVDQRYDALKEQLFNSVTAKIEGVDKPGEELSSEIVQDLRAGFATILQACKRARDLKEDAKRHDIPEIECRHEWDSLIIEFVKGKNNVGAWLERTIRMPRNSRADHLEDEDFKAIEKKVFLAYNRSQTNVVDASGPIGLWPQEYSVLRSIVFKMDEDNLPQSVRSRVRLDPLTGRCDALAAVEVRNFVASNAKFGLKHALKGFAFVSQMQPPARTTKTPSTKTASPKYLEVPSHSNSEVLTPPVEKTSAVESTPPYNLFHHNFQSEDIRNRTGTSSAELASKLQQLSLHSSPLDEPNAEHAGFSLDLPLFVVEYKKIQTDFIVTGANQHRMYSTAAVSFLAAVGIMNFPIFSLLTDGCRGVITCTWAETNDDIQCVRIAERNGVDFDLSDPLSAFRFAVFLCKLAREHSKNLLAAFMEVKDKLLPRLQEKNRDTRWSLANQIDDLKKASK